MWEKIKINSYNPFTNKSEKFVVEGINKDGLIISRAAEFAIVVEKQVIRNLIVERIKKLERDGKISNVENQINIASLDYLTFFTYKNREILLLSPVMGGPSIECVTQDAFSIGVKYIVRLGTTGSLNRNIPMYSYIATTGAIRHDATSDHYLPVGFPANPDKKVHDELVGQLKTKKIAVEEGISYTTSTRFKEDVPALLELNNNLGVLNIEMESATLFSVAKVLRMQAASISMVTDCLADEDLTTVSGTLVGVPKYEEYMNLGIHNLLTGFEAIIESFSKLPKNSEKFTKLKKDIEKSRK